MSESNDENKETSTLSPEAQQMFFFRKTVVFLFITLIIIIMLFMALVILWSVHKSGDVPAMDSLVSIANTIATMFEKFMGGG